MPTAENRTSGDDDMDDDVVVTQVGVSPPAQSEGGGSVDWSAVDAEVVNITATEAISLVSAGETGGAASMGAVNQEESALAGVSTRVTNGAAFAGITTLGAGSQIELAASGEDSTVYLQANDTNGRIQIMANGPGGEVAIMLNSPNGTHYWLTVADDGTLVADPD